MRLPIVIALFVHVVARAQPQPPSVCFVLAEERNVPRPVQHEVQVVQVYQERIPYVGIDATYLAPARSVRLQGGPLFRDTLERWTVYYPIVVPAAEPYLLVIAGADTMRMDLPEDPLAWPDQAVARASRDTPEVIRFRKGRYGFQEVIDTPWATKAATELAHRLVAEDDAVYQRQLAEQAMRPASAPPAPPPPQPPPLMTAEQWEREVAQRPGLTEVVLLHASGDSVVVRITGRIMLTGGCASSMPLFGLEMRTDTGWVERLPFASVQMDCGMPWADWTEHVLSLPLAWWVHAHSPDGQRELVAGTYRIVLQGGNMKQVRTQEFVLR